MFEQFFEWQRVNLEKLQSMQTALLGTTDINYTGPYLHGLCLKEVIQDAQ